MSLSEAWDRLFWSVILVIFAGLLWMKYLQPYAACEGPGFVVALIVGAIYYYIGHRKAQQEEEVPESATELPTEVVDPISTDTSRSG